ncbi:MAG: hypothetical protein AB1941_21780 [Gemmatimonadota bacterium]
MRPLRTFGTVLLGSTALASVSLPAAAQWRSPSWADLAGTAPSAPPGQARTLAFRSREQRPEYGRMIRGGLVGGAVGAGVGLLAPGARGDIGGAVRNATLGAAAGIPVGVHLANRSRGSLLLSGAVSLGIGAAVFQSAGSGGEAVPLLIAAPVVELVASTLVERATTP